jgi:hypothetical protein
MNPWVDRRPSDPKPPASPRVICPNYPTCPKEERKYVQEIRSKGKDIPKTFILSNGVKAVDFSLQYLMTTHFRRKVEDQKY